MALSGVIFLLAVIAIILFFLTRRPYQSIDSYSLAMDDRIQNVRIQSNIALAKSKIIYGDKPAGIRVISRGFGWIGAENRMDIDAHIDGNTLDIIIIAFSEGYFAELKHQLSISLPTAYKDRLTIEINQADLPANR